MFEQEPLHLPERDEPSPPPARVGKYVITREIGRGGMAVVYEAHDPGLQRRIALKVLRETGEGGSVIRRLHREAAIAAQLQHPNIVGIHEIGMVREESGLAIHFIAMDYVEGTTLAEIIRGRKTDRGDLFRMLEDVARAVAHAHSHGVVHRDLKPANVLVDRTGRVVLTDFGLAHAESFHTQLTRSHAVMGTPQYMAPEQVEGRTAEIGPRTDVYALGVVLYEILAGRSPYAAETPARLYQKILHEDPPRPGGGDLEVVCLKAMEKDRGRRYSDALEFAEDLARFRKGEPVRARRPSLFYRLRRGLRRRRGWVAVAAVLLAAGASTLIVLRVQQGKLSRVERESERRSAEAEAYRRLLERMKPVEALIKDARTHFYIAGADIRAKLYQVEKALGELETIAADPENARHPDLWALLGMGWYFVGDTVRAEEALRRAESLGSADGWVDCYLGRICMERSMSALLAAGDAAGARRDRSKEWGARALEYWRRPRRGWIGADPIDLHIAEAYLSLARGDDERVLRLCDEGLRRFGRVPGTEEYCNLRGWIQGSRERRRQVEAYSEAIERRPHYAWGFFMRGIARAALGDDKGATEDYDQAIAINPRFVEAYNNRGFQWMNAREFDAASADFNRVLAIRPDFIAARVNRAHCRSTRGDLKGALEDLEEAIRLNPRLAIAYNNRGNIRRRQGDVEGALADFEKAIDLDSSYPDPHANIARVAQDRGDWDRALAEYDKMIAIDPKIPQAYVERAGALMAKGVVEEALADLEKALGMDPKIPFAYVLRGNIRLSRRETDAALADFEKAIDLAPKMAEAYTARGNVKFVRNDPDGAVADYEKAIGLNPEVPEPYAARGIVRDVRGDLKGAIADYEKALSLGSPGWPYRKLTEGHLREARRKLGE